MKKSPLLTAMVFGLASATTALAQDQVVDSVERYKAAFRNAVPGITESALERAIDPSTRQTKNSLRDCLSTNYPESLAGLTVKYQPEFAFNALMKDAKKGNDTSKCDSIASFDTLSVSFSKNELEEGQGLLLDLPGFRGNGMSYLVTVDLATNTLQATIERKNENQFGGRIRALQRKYPFIKIDTVETINVSNLQRMPGGMEVWDWDYNEGAYFPCTTGFNGTTNGTPSVVTAAHCGTVIERSRRQLEADEMEWLETADEIGSSARPGIEASSHKRAGETYPPYIRYPTSTGTTETPVNGVKMLRDINPANYDIVCKVGRTTGETCGFYKGAASVSAVQNGLRISRTLPYFETYNGQRVGNGGDSGGPVYIVDRVGLHALGVVSIGSHPINPEAAQRGYTGPKQPDFKRLYWSPTDRFSSIPFVVSTTR